MWSEEQQDEETKCDHFKCCVWALQGVRNPLSLQIRKAIRHVDVSGSYLTVLWWRRSRTRECLHPRYWRLLVWSRSGSWDLWEKEKDGGNKLMQPPHQPKLSGAQLEIAILAERVFQYNQSYYSHYNRDLNYAHIQYCVKVLSQPSSLYMFLLLSDGSAERPGVCLVGLWRIWSLKTWFRCSSSAEV